MQKLSNEALNRPSLSAYKNQKKHPVALVLDHVRSLHNVGAAFRTCDAFGMEKIYLCGITGKPPHREITKTALGATESVAWEHAPDTLPVVEKLRTEGRTIVCLEQTTGSMSLLDFQPSRAERYAFVFGHEVFGVAQEVVDACDLALEIPQFGTKHSLNISVSIGVALWHYVAQVLRGN